MVRDIRHLVEIARRAGWEVMLTRSGHVRFVPPIGQGRIIVGPSTPSDWRAYRNLRGDLRRAGLEVP